MAQVVADSLLRAIQLGLLSLGLTLVYSVSRFANIAHVEFATVAAFLAYWTVNGLGLPLWLAALITLAATGTLGVVLNRTIFRRLSRFNAALAMIGSLAVSVVIRSLLQIVAGSHPKHLRVLVRPGTDVLSALITQEQIWTLAFGGAALSAFLLVWFRTDLGRAIRAVATNPELAEASGLDRPRLVDLVWFGSAALGGLAGVLLATDTQVSVEMGFSLILPVFAVVILGGIGSPTGALVAALLLAALENVILKVDFGHLLGHDSGYVSISYRGAIGMLLLVVVLLYRPQGIFGWRGRRA